MNDIKILGFEIKGLAAPGRVYSHTHDGGATYHVAFNEPANLDPAVPDERWSGLPVMFLYVQGFDAALTLAREIAAAHKAGNVDAYVGRWERERARPASKGATEGERC